MTNKNQELLPHLFRTEYRKVISVLVRHFGFDDIGAVEDITSEVFLIAAETWGLKGIPDNPPAWIYTVAKRKALDEIKRRQIFQQKISPSIRRSESEITLPSADVDLSEENIRDSQLQMMFVLADPVISIESRIALILRILCGFGIDEIASAFLTTNETIQKRLYRGKTKLREANLSFRALNADQLAERTDLVLTSLYLLFNEGYYSSKGDNLIKKDFCFEAMRLNLLLIENEKINKPAAEALFALMCFHVSRFDARVDEQGDFIRFDDQDTELWNKELILRGNDYLSRSSRGEELSTYHLEAAIAFWHTTIGREEEKWSEILQLYNQLLILKYSPLAALNRTFALYKVYGKEPAIQEALQLGLDGNHLYHAMMGYLYKDIDNKKALKELETARNLAKTKTEKAQISRDIDSILRTAS